MAFRGEEGGDWSWEYDAPQFVDFAKLTSTDFINDEDYFNVDHELGNHVYEVKTISQTNTLDKNGQLIATAFPAAKGKKLGSKSTELLNIYNSEQKPIIGVGNCKIELEFKENTAVGNCKFELEFKENTGEPSLNSLNSTCGLSKLPHNLDSKSLESNGVSQPPMSTGLDYFPAILENKQVETRNPGPAVPQFMGKAGILEERISSKNEVEEATETVLCQTKALLSATGKENVLAGDPEPDANKVCTPVMGKLNNRGRTVNRNCRQVDQATSAKKRLSMSVDRGHDRLRLLSPSPPPQQEGSLERKENYTCQKSRMPSAIPKSHGSGACHFLAFHKMRSTSKSQMIVESQNEITLGEKEFVRGLTENNVEAVEEARVNRVGVVPHTGLPFQLLGAQHVTLPAPFSFEERTKRMLMKKEEKIHKFLETEKMARQFHAQPFPEILYSAAQPKKVVKPTPKPPTKPVPFQLHLPNPTRKPATVEEPKPTFRAKPAKVLHKEPFLPQKTSQRTIDFVPPLLSTQQRAEKRAEWDRLKQEKELQAEQERLEKERQRKEQEEQELRKLRATTVHKANPIRHYKSVAVVHSAKPSTIPKSPAPSRRSNAI